MNDGNCFKCGKRKLIGLKWNIPYSDVCRCGEVD